MSLLGLVAAVVAMVLYYARKGHDPQLRSALLPGRAPWRDDALIAQTHGAEPHLRDLELTVYRGLFKRNSPAEVLSTPLARRCELFFQTCYLDHRWLVDPLLIRGRDEHESPGEGGDEGGEAQRNEQAMADLATIQRVYNRCFVEPQPVTQVPVDEFLVHKSLNRKLDPVDIDRRVFPWLTGRMPTYERWNGEVSTTLPDLTAFGGPSPVPVSLAHFWARIKGSLNARGIVLTLPNHHTYETEGLLLLLRLHNTSLPVQIVHNGDLAQGAKNRLRQVARQTWVRLPENLIPEGWKSRWESDDDLYRLPRLELWFVDALSAINQKYAERFSHYAAKFLPMLFSSFAEYLLVDSDTVPVKDPRWFFDAPEFHSGAFFWKDRFTNAPRPVLDGWLFQRISPSVVDSVVFGIPLANKSFEIPYFEGMEHFMEAGAVTLDYRRHMGLVLMATFLNMFDATRELSHGDKELVWLGFVVNGDESFTFSELPSAAIGQLVPLEYNVGPAGEVRSSHQICLRQNGHFANGELVWFNGGFLLKGRTYFNWNITERRNTFLWMSDDEVTHLGTKPLPIEHGIVPPIITDPDKYAWNTDGESPYPWVVNDNHPWNYCGFDLVGGAWGDQNTTATGHLFEISTEQRELLAFLGACYVSVPSLLAVGA